MLPRLDADLISATAGERLLTAIEIHESIGSTNARAAQAALPWMLVLAEHQHAGRGRLGRQWQENPRTGLAMSVLVPAPPEPLLGWLPLLTGLALRAAVAEVAGLTPDLKWPNDLLGPGGGKLAGILCERVESGVVIGAGLNVHHTAEQLPVPTATSLALLGVGEQGRDRSRLAGSFVAGVAARHRRLIEEPDAVREDYRAACATLGAQITVQVGPGRAPVAGTARDVDERGRLVVAGPDGLLTLAAGDVHHVRMAQ